MSDLEVSSENTSEPSITGRSMADPDYLLQQLVSLCNGAFIGPELTLIVSGTTISGALVPATEFLEYLASEMKTGLERAFSDSDEKENIAKGVYDIISQYKSFYETALPANLTGYIHLKDVRIFANGHPSMPSNGFRYWRGRLSEVSGFAYGGMR